jgi:hypothetical protein
VHVTGVSGRKSPDLVGRNLEHVGLDPEIPDGVLLERSGTTGKTAAQAARLRGLYRKKLSFHKVPAAGYSDAAPHEDILLQEGVWQDGKVLSSPN